MDPSRDSLKLTNFLKSTKIDKILDILALPLFIICSEIHIVVKAINSHLSVITKAMILS